MNNKKMLFLNIQILAIITPMEHHAEFRVWNFESWSKLKADSSFKQHGDPFQFFQWTMSD